MSFQPLYIRSVYIACTTDAFAIYTKSAKYLQFSKQYAVKIPAGKAVWSDGLLFDLRPLSRLSITINYIKVPRIATVHMGSCTTSYILQGVTDAHTDFAKSFKENHRFNIAGIDVCDDSARCIAIIGNSITDGKCSTNNAQNRWPDIMAETLQDKYKVKDLGVLNLGIGNNRVALPGGFGYMAKERFDHDILGQNGVKSVIIFEGVNDIAASKGNGETVVRKLIEAYGEMIKKAAREKVNDWIRLQKDKVNGILDFDKLLSNPLDPHRMKENVQGGDWLHPNPEGYLEMGEYAAGVISGERLKGNP